MKPQRSTENQTKQGSLRSTCRYLSWLGDVQGQYTMELEVLMGVLNAVGPSKHSTQFVN
jgi:hypothetical protein